MTSWDRAITPVLVAGFLVCLTYGWMYDWAFIFTAAALLGIIAHFIRKPNMTDPDDIMDLREERRLELEQQLSEARRTIADVAEITNRPTYIYAGLDSTQTLLGVIAQIKRRIKTYMDGIRHEKGM